LIPQKKIGNFKNNRVEYHKKGKAPEVLDHDFLIKELGITTPYGIYDLLENHGFVNVGITSDTAQFAVESIRKWWNIIGKIRYPKVKIYILPPMLVVAMAIEYVYGNMNYKNW
jgi:hypothetical protein